MSRDRPARPRSRFVPSAIVARIRQGVDLVALISEHVALKRSGRGFLGLCPFHQEKSPSFRVDPERGFFHCFGCNAGGDAFTFLMRVSGASFSEASRELAQRADVPISALRGRKGAASSRSSDTGRWMDAASAAGATLRSAFAAQRTALLRELFELEDERFVVEAALRHDPAMHHEFTQILVRRGQPFIDRLGRVETALTELGDLERTSLPGPSPTARALLEAIR